MQVRGVAAFWLAFAFVFLSLPQAKKRGRGDTAEERTDRADAPRPRWTHSAGHLRDHRCRDTVRSDNEYLWWNALGRALPTVRSRARPGRNLIPAGFYRL